jgi:alkylation response protein AidB-like acyl-CoA dehydrogenase
MDFEPSSEQQMLIDQVRRYVREEIIPLEARLDPDASELDPEDYKRLTEKTRRWACSASTSQGVRRAGHRRS